MILADATALRVPAPGGGLTLAAELVAALDAVAFARVRVRRVRDDLESVRAAGARLDRDTAWRTRAAEGYRNGLARWRDVLTEAATRLETLDAELRDAAARLEVRGGMP